MGNKRYELTEEQWNRVKDLIPRSKMGRPPKDNRLMFSEQNINELEKIIESCSCTNAADAAINLILVEEMPAYFIGQKSLEEVAKVAQDRAQKVLDERG